MEKITENMHGYRSWAAMLTEDGPRLEPEFHRTSGAWVKGVQPKAEHQGDAIFMFAHDMNRQIHDAPGKDCKCGYFGYFQPYNTKAHNLNRSKERLRVCGVIRGWGVTEVHEFGFRSQYAEIVAISPPVDAEDPTEVFGGSVRRRGMPGEAVLALLADYYEVPWYPSFADMVKAHPPTHENEEAPEPYGHLMITNPGVMPGSILSAKQVQDTLDYIQRRHGSASWFTSPGQTWHTGGIVSYTPPPQIQGRDPMLSIMDELNQPTKKRKWWQWRK